MRPRTTSQSAHVASTSGKQRSRCNAGTSTAPRRSAAPTGAPPMRSASVLKLRSVCSASFCAERSSSSVCGRRPRLIAGEGGADDGPAPTNASASVPATAPPLQGAPPPGAELGTSSSGASALPGRRLPLEPPPFARCSRARARSVASMALAPYAPSALVGAKGEGRGKAIVCPARASGGV
jgi:hypothetical protein